MRIWKSLPIVVLAVAAAIVPAAGASETTATTAAPPRVLDTVVVSGMLPGPGLWKIERDGRVLWVLGTIAPMPRRMQWETLEMELLLERAGVLLLAPTAEIKTDLGMFRSMLLLPSLLGARKNPDDAKLADVLPAALYERWRGLASRYLPRQRKVETWRPIFAAGELYDRAIGKSGLTLEPRVRERVEKLAKQRKVPIERPSITLTITEPRDAIREFRQGELDDQACFAAVLERLEVDLAHMQARANAWATGDLDTLRTLPDNNPSRTCVEAILGASVLQKRGFDDVPERLRALWLERAEAALATHATSVAVLPIDPLLDPAGPLADLKARGYRITAPGAGSACEHCDTVAEPEQ